jgi:hypothetical protein
MIPIAGEPLVGAHRNNRPGRQRQSRRKGSGRLRGSALRLFLWLWKRRRIACLRLRIGRLLLRRRFIRRRILVLSPRRQGSRAKRQYKNAQRFQVHGPSPHRIYRHSHLPPLTTMIIRLF